MFHSLDNGHAEAHHLENLLVERINSSTFAFIVFKPGTFIPSISFAKLLTHQYQLSSVRREQTPTNTRSHTFIQRTSFRFRPPDQFTGLWSARG